MGIALPDIQRAFKQVLLPPGRLERVRENIFIDYAHTPDALENSLLSLKATGYDKIILVFGCGGDRDKKKRPLMGMIASEAAEYTIITSDNPRSENPDVICGEIKEGFVYKKNQCQVIVDRSQALSEGFRLLRENPTAALLVAGKGHEEYQILPTGKIHFSDREEIRKLMLSNQ
jgi:UDP-N-acetylmuramoyl-L-alanyl-D-glutamate--2,6-diaminopimelate ligase